ncbi:MAG: CocE/NonD family hydrolase [Phycisphaerae bacterium]|nr:CocE/NonD family hydrolase [Phycisphaerae bacterium]
MTVGGRDALASEPKDKAWYDQRGVAKAFGPRYEGEVRSSQYITMRDGCKIAVMVFLPEGLAAGEKIPTLLHQTRYWRSVAYKPPLDRVRESERLPGLRKVLVPRGYAWVAADVRGSGASFGYRPCEYSPDEIRDGFDIVDWIIRQPWSDGQVCAAGVSYDGGTAELLASNKHPAVKAIAPLFSMFDPYQEVLYPGGIHLSWFTQVWGGLGKALDRNRLPDLVVERYGPMIKLLCEGVRPVEADADGALLAAAVKSHAYNWDLHETALRLMYRDDQIPYDWTLGLESMSPYVYTKAIDACGVAVYGVSSWYDAAFAHSAIKRHRTLTGKKNRLLLGPWNHGGEVNCSPFGGGRAQFNLYIEVFRFFEHHLRGAKTGIEGEKPIHYYTMGQEAWKAADEWPPRSEARTFWFGAEGVLGTSKPTAPDAADERELDYTHGTGGKSRWNCLVMGGAVIYPDRPAQDKKLQCYTTGPLEKDVEVTGHPVVTLWVSSPRKDGNFFAYLEDVDAEGNVHLITEGMLRALHRTLSKEAPPYRQTVPYRTFRRADAALLTPGQAAELTFDLFPVSHLFKAGHRIRVAVGGADVDHFANPPGPPPAIKVHRATERPSRIVLPIVSRE